MARGLASQQFHSYEVISELLDSCIASKDEKFNSDGIGALVERWEQFVAAMCDILNDSIVTIFSINWHSPQTQRDPSSKPENWVTDIQFSVDWDFIRLLYDWKLGELQQDWHVVEKL